MFGGRRKSSPLPCFRARCAHAHRRAVDFGAGAALPRSRGARPVKNTGGPRNLLAMSWSRCSGFFFVQRRAPNRVNSAYSTACWPRSYFLLTWEGAAQKAVPGLVIPIRKNSPRTYRFRGAVVYVQAFGLKTAAHVFGSCYQPRGSRAQRAGVRDRAASAPHFRLTRMDADRRCIWVRPLLSHRAAHYCAR